MRAARRTRRRGEARVLVAGNANSGKTTVFNALTGARAHVTNYPGVTVTRSSRRVTLPDAARAEIVDLPGTYSLTAQSPDEQVAVDAVNGRRGDLPDAVVVVVDAGALERGLYLVLQIIETGVPVIVALNMLDEASAAGVQYDAARLEQWLGATVVPTVASKGQGIDELRRAIATAVTMESRGETLWSGFPETVQADVMSVEQALAGSGFARTPAVARSWAIWSLLSLEHDDATGSGLPTSVVTCGRYRASPGEAGQPRAGTGDRQRPVPMDRDRRPGRPEGRRRRHADVDEPARWDTHAPGLGDGCLRGRHGGAVRGTVRLGGSAHRGHRGGDDRLAGRR